MSTRDVLLKTAGGLGAAAVAALATGVVVERRVVRTRRAASRGISEFTSLRSRPVPVRADDGIRLHVEVDEVAPYGGHADPAEPTLVFVHGYSLNLDCWHYQRAAFRGKYRLVFYDQRSHGRSERSSLGRATIEQLGEDLRAVIDEVAPEGPLVLVGHSMGGMSIMAFAELHPELFAERVAGVALVSTTAGDLHPHRILGKLLPDAVGDFAAPRLIAALASAPELVDSARRRGSNIGFLVADLFAFGKEVPVELVEFLDEMLGATPFEVLAEFFPGLSEHDKFTALAHIATKPTVVVCGTADRLTPISHSRRLAREMPGARLVESPGAGHMVILEDPGRVNAEIERLVAQAVPAPVEATRSSR
ncbi:MAG TPA: alpha/beta hydrolase [Marmoricola sp.]|nr:alpha/beta hydrolase [Marmoricola sp.]